MASKSRKSDVAIGDTVNIRLPQRFTQPNMIMGFAPLPETPQVGCMPPCGNVAKYQYGDHALCEAHAVALRAVLDAHDESERASVAASFSTGGWIAQEGLDILKNLLAISDAFNREYSGKLK